MTDNWIKQNCLLLREGKFDTQTGGGDNLKAIFSAAALGDQPLVVHFHGGLVDKAAGLASVAALAPTYKAAGTFPIFVIWESGWHDIIENDLPTIFREPVFQKILTSVCRFAKGKLTKANETGVPRAAGAIPLEREVDIRNELRAPRDGSNIPFPNLNTDVLGPSDDLTPEERRQFEETLEEDLVFEAHASELRLARQSVDSNGTIARNASPEQTRHSLMDSDVLLAMSVESEGSRSVSAVLLIARCALVLAAVVRRFAERRGHGFYLTVVEEIFRAFYAGNAGRYLWDGMKQDITDSFGVADMCGGSRFLDALEGLTRKQGRVTLVGHSAGAIYVCRFLQEVQARGIAPTLAFNIILIAPACDFTLLAKTLQSAGHRIDGFRIFGMSDELERRDAIAPLVYPSSLLYFVSGVIEKPADCPLVGMQRYYNSPYDTVSNFPEIAYVRQHALLANPHTLNWSLTTEGPGYNCDMRSHGGWENAPATVDSIVHIIKSGY